MSLVITWPVPYGYHDRKPHKSGRRTNIELIVFLLWSYGTLSPQKTAECHLRNTGTFCFCRILFVYFVSSRTFVTFDHSGVSNLVNSRSVLRNSFVLS
jgi:hypothetical protein